MVDGRGIAFVPGLTDSHIHPLMGTIRTQGADLFDATSLDDIRGRILAERERVGPDGWLQGWGLTTSRSKETGIRGDLFDYVAAGQPMLLEFFDAHTALANRTALAIAGIDGPVAFAEKRAWSASTAFPPASCRVGRHAARARRDSRGRRRDAL